MHWVLCWQVPPHDPPRPCTPPGPPNPADCERLMAECEANKQRLSLALQAARMVVWEVNPATGQATVMENAADVFGISCATLLDSTDAGFALMHPDDREAHREIFIRTMQERGSHTTQFRIQRPDTGETVWVEEQAHTLRGTEGRPDRLIGIMVDITKRKRAEEELQKAHRLLHDRASLLEEVVQARTARLQEIIGELETFSYSIAHDLRGPLRSLEGYARILLDEHSAELRPDAQVYLKRIASAAGRMDQLTQELLNYSRLANTSATAEPVDLDALVQEIVDTYPQFSDRRVPIDLRAPLGVVSANHGLLVQVFSNLLANAAKFAHPERRPAITLSSEIREQRVRVLVQDNGIGIPEDQQERIFGLFEKLATGHEGTGIGLAIARKAVERMGGAIGVTSTLGSGSCFWVELPRART